MDYLAKNKLKKVGLALLSVVVLGASVMGIANLANNLKSELKTIHPSFTIGAIDENGKGIKDETKLYSDEFECRGLEVKLDFDNDINYQVFFYESDGDFIKSTDVLEDDYVIEDENLATHARVMIIPQWTNLEATEDKTLEELQVVNWKNKHSFVNQMEIKVNRDQDEELIDNLDLYDENKVYEDYYSDITDYGNKVSKEGISTLNKVDILKYYSSSYKIEIEFKKALTESDINLLKDEKTDTPFIAFTHGILGTSEVDASNNTWDEVLGESGKRIFTLNFSCVDKAYKEKLSLSVNFPTNNVPTIRLVKI